MTNYASSLVKLDFILQTRVFLPHTMITYISALNDLFCADVPLNQTQTHYLA